MVGGRSSSLLPRKYFAVREGFQAAASSLQSQNLWCQILATATRAFRGIMPTQAFNQSTRVSLCWQM